MVGQHRVLLATDLVKTDFGEFVAKVCNCLLRRGPLSREEIKRDTGYNPPKVKTCLQILIQHSCVQAFSVPLKPGVPEDVRTVTLYMALIDNIIHRMRYAKFLIIVADDLGQQCETLLMGLLQHGRLSFEQLVGRAASKEGNADVRENLVANFNRLLQAHYIERCPKAEPFLSLETEDDAPPKKRGDKSALQPITLEKLALEAATLSDAERFAGIMGSGDDSLETKATQHFPPVGEKRKHEDMNKESDATIAESEVFWRANFEKFVHCLKKKVCVANKGARLGLDAAVVLEAMIEDTDGHQLNKNIVTSSLDSIFARLGGKSQGRIMNIQHARTVLETLGCRSSTEDTTTFYSVDLKTIIEECQLDEVEALILGRYGRDAYRIFRLLSTRNKPFEMEKISDNTFVDKKDTVGLLYKLWKDNYLQMQKLIPDGPGKTFVLWKVNKNSLGEHILDDMHHAALNVSQRIAYDYEQNNEVAGSDKLTDSQKRYRSRRIVLENALQKLADSIMLFHDFML